MNGNRTGATESSHLTAHGTDLATADAQTRLELTLAASEIGTWLWDAVHDCVIADRNLSRMFGLTAGTARVADFIQLIHPDDRSRVERAIAATLERGEPYEIEYRTIPPDGLVRHLLARGRPESNERGEVIGLHGVVLDISDRVRAEQAHIERARKVEQQARIFDTTLSSITDFAYVFDREGRFVFVNKALLDLWGLSLEQAIGRDFFDLQYEPALAAKLQRQIRQVFDTGERLCDETSYTSPSGAEGFYEYIFSPVRGSDGRVEVIAGSTRDISERKAIERRLQTLLREQQQLQQQNAELLEAERVARTESERLNRIKDDFLATLGHELRTPLNSILGWAEFLDGGHVEAAQLEEGLEAIGRNAQAQAQMIEDLLDLSRIIAGKLQIDAVPVALDDLLLQTIRSVQPAAAAKGLNVTRRFDAGASMVMGAPERLQQVFWNIIANAIKFTPAGGSIDVALTHRGEVAQVRVADTGDGIEATFLPHVFERFRQADSNITRRHGGLGIGLSLVSQFVEMHGGSVHAHSDGKGRGSTLTVTLPLMESPRFSADAELPTIPAVRLEGVRVLVVDDDGDTRALMARIFAGRLAHVMSAATTAEALVILHSQPVELLVSDIGLPTQDGYELVRQIRRLPPAQGGSVPAVAVTAYARPEDRRRALAAGFQAHIAKPIQQAELLRVCAGLLHRK